MQSPTIEHPSASQTTPDCGVWVAETMATAATKSAHAAMAETTTMWPLAENHRASKPGNVRKNTRNRVGAISSTKTPSHRRIV